MLNNSIESMNRESLEKLSKEELITLVESMQNQRKKKGKHPKFTVPNEVKKFISKYIV